MTTEAELKARLKHFFGDVTFTELGDQSFAVWIHGHCIMWIRRDDGEWECDEL